MSARRLFHSICILLGVLVVGLGVLCRSSSKVLAQCENPQPSSCITCHQSQDPVADKGEWHIIHAGQDLCINCHGGNATVMEKDAAHQGMVAQPLNDVYTDCHSCHPDYEARAERFALTLGATPGSCATPTAAALGNIPGGPPSGSIAMSSDLAVTASLPAAFLLILGEVAALSLFALALGWLARHAA